MAGCGFGTVVSSTSGKNTIEILLTNLVCLNSLKLIALSGSMKPAVRVDIEIFAHNLCGQMYIVIHLAIESQVEI